MHMLARLLIALCLVSGPALLFVIWRGVISISEAFGLGVALIVALLCLPAIFGIALAIDSREAREARRSPDQSRR